MSDHQRAAQAVRPAKGRCEGSYPDPLPVGRTTFPKIGPSCCLPLFVHRVRRLRHWFCEHCGDASSKTAVTGSYVTWFSSRQTWSSLGWALASCVQSSPLPARHRNTEVTGSMDSVLCCDRVKMLTCIKCKSG